MRHILFAEQNSNYAIALLMKATAFNKQELQNNYVFPLKELGVNCNSVIAFTLELEPGKKKPSAGFMKDYLAGLLKALDSLQVKHLYVTDAEYFKQLTGERKAEPHFGYALPCKVAGYEHMTVVLGINYQQLIYNPEIQAKLDLSLKTLADSVQGVYMAIGTGIIHSAQYPQGVQEIAQALESLHRHPRLTADIEAFSLAFNEAGIGTVSFAWNRHEGLAFACDYEADPANPCRLVDGTTGNLLHGVFTPNPAVRHLLKRFFETYQGEIVWHNGCGYDVKVIIATLWMADLKDTEGLLQGLEVMTRKIQDTKIIAYLATNSTAGNVLGLKSLAHEFAGNWAKDDIKDIRRIPLKELLQYNLVDALSTFYVFEKFYPRMVADQQLEIYEGLMLPSAAMLIQTELTGLPLSKRRVAEVKAKLEAIRQEKKAAILGSAAIHKLNLLLRAAAWIKDLEDRKAKAKNPEKIKEKPQDAFDDLSFNPNSDPQKRRLFYEVMSLPEIDFTDTKMPATGAETVKKLIHHCQDTGHKEVLESLIVYDGVSTILDTFIPAFEGAIDKGDGDVVWLHGNFNLGGTVSGRLSSSEPNLTNIPAKVKIKVGDVEIDLGKLVKYCFVSPPGWLFCGADFNSLEDYISALTTKDPNKLKVYEEGFDGHCLRASYYYRDQLMHVDQDDPKSVNSLKKTHEDLRQESKVPTFALTYQGTWRTLVTNLGWEPAKAQRIEGAYHEMYKVSDQWVQDRLEQASKDGFVTVAFGLRVRTPMLSQVVWGSTKMPSEAAAEGRTAGNAMGQSYCMLTMRAMMDFMRKVWKSKYRLRIKPAAIIHDAIYPLIADDVEVVEWANRELIESMKWQELPEIQHDKVKLGANLGIFWPDWAHETTLPNDADRKAIITICNTAKEELLKKAA